MSLQVPVYLDRQAEEGFDLCLVEPPLGRTTEDERFVALLREWIESQEASAPR